MLTLRSAFGPEGFFAVMAASASPRGSTVMVGPRGPLEKHAADGPSRPRRGKAKRGHESYGDVRASGLRDSLFSNPADKPAARCPRISPPFRPPTRRTRGALTR